MQFALPEPDQLAQEKPVPIAAMGGSVAADFAPGLSHAAAVEQALPMVAKETAVSGNGFVRALPVQGNLDSAGCRQLHQCKSDQRRHRMNRLVLEPQHPA